MAGEAGDSGRSGSPVAEVRLPPEACPAAPAPAAETFPTRQDAAPAALLGRPVNAAGPSRCPTRWRPWPRRCLLRSGRMGGQALMLLFRERVRARLVEQHAISQDLATRLPAWRHPGFSVSVGERISPDDPTTIEDMAGRRTPVNGAAATRGSYRCQCRRCWHCEVRCRRSMRPSCWRRLKECDDA